MKRLFAGGKKSCRRPFTGDRRNRPFAGRKQKINIGHLREVVALGRSWVARGLHGGWRKEEA